MIIITLKDVADFATMFATNRISPHVFYELRTPGGETRFAMTCFHFLGTMGSLNVLFQINVNVPSNLSVQDMVTDMRSNLQGVEDVMLVDGTIREIYMSLS